MPRGPKGEKRPADVIGNAIMVAKIATGEIEDTPAPSKAESSKKGGLKGGVARARALAPEERHRIAQKAAATRWKKDRLAPETKE